MSDDNTQVETSTEASAPAPAETQTSTEKTFTQADLDRIVADRVAREKSKYADYGDLKKKAAAAMTDQERLVSEAEQRGRSAALKSSGERLAKAEFKALAAGQVAGDAVDGFLEYADLQRFVDDNGEPDTKAIEAAVKRLASAAAPPTGTNFDAGARANAPAPKDFNSLIRQAAGRE
jgi:hypothetical protein